MGQEVLLRLSIPQAQALTWLTEAASKDQARPTLTGLNLEWSVNKDDELEFIAAATDSYMLATRTIVFPVGTYEALPSEGSLLVPAKKFADALKAIVKVGKEYPLKEAQATIIQIEDAAVTLASADGSEYKVLKHIDAEFPKWKSLIPDNPIDGFTIHEMQEAGDGRTKTEKERHHEFKFLLPAISPALMARATRIVAQPVSQLGNSKPLRWQTGGMVGANLKPVVMTVPNDKGNTGDLTILMMPVRL